MLSNDVDENGAEVGEVSDVEETGAHSEGAEFPSKLIDTQPRSLQKKLLTSTSQCCRDGGQ